MTDETSALTVMITGMNLCGAKPFPDGSKVIAHFDCEVRGLSLTGCYLVKTPKNGFVAFPPRIETARGNSKAVRFIDNSLQHAVMNAARKSYIAFGGEGGEWTPRSDHAA